MKKLNKLRLVNWHYISNETIEFKNNVLLTGANASGKSTILDALTYLLTAGNQSFNQAANEKSGRDLRGYVKCKLGQENRAYLRDGDVTGDICAEFYDDTTNEYFVIGTIIDASETQVRNVFYSGNNLRLEDITFYDPTGNVFSITEFKKLHKNLSFYSSNKEARSAFRNLYGSINSDFFSMITKSVAFKPIENVKEFIYQNILEKKEVKIDEIQNAIRSLKDLEATLKVIQAKINRLTELRQLIDESKNIIDKQKYYDYLMKLFDVKKIESSKLSIQDQIEIEKTRLQTIMDDLNEQTKHIYDLQEKSQDLYDALLNDEGFKNSEYITKQINKLNQELEQLGDPLTSYINKADSIKSTLKQLKEEFDAPEFNEFYNLSLKNTDLRMLEDIKLKVTNYQSVFKRISVANSEEIGSLNYTKNTYVEKIRQIKEAQHTLNSNRLSYPQGLTQLRAEIADNLKRIYNKDISVHIFCELVEIIDKKWATVIESFIANQRFVLIVEPKYYEAALSIFARIKNKYSYGFGIVNTDAIQQYNRIQPNSLASIMTTENKDAQNYINFICGNVIMCDSESELKDYSIAVTIDGLLYRGYVVRSMNLNVTKYIGSQALDEQKGRLEAESIEAATGYQETSAKIADLREANEKIDCLNLDSFISNIDDLIDYYNIKDKITKLNIEQNKAKKLSTTETQDEYNKVKAEINEAEARKNAINQSIGKQKEVINNYNEKLISINNELIEINKTLENIASDNIALDSDCRKEYKELTNQMPIERAYNNVQGKLETVKNSYQNMLNGIINKQKDYITEFNSNLSVGISECDIFMAELNKLEKTELVKYESKVRQARETAEIIFKEDFISTLRGNIQAAEAEISKINETLSTIPFGNDKYEFIFPKSQEFGGFYDMFKSEEVTDGKSIFTVEFEKTYAEQLDELFTAIASDSLDNNKAFNKFTDYRTYMDYDIRITNQNGDSMLYSKVFKEKSGGETQVPFYVAIIASFVRIYSQYSNKSTIGLVMFDEVFDKMDSTRMQSMMNFMTSMPLQFILACPPQRMNIIANYVDTTIIVFRKDYKTQVLPITTKEELDKAKENLKEE